MSVSVRIPEKQNQQDICECGEGMWDEKEGEQEGKKKEIYFKALTHVIMETGQLKSIKQASQLENPG